MRRQTSQMNIIRLLVSCSDLATWAHSGMLAKWRRVYVAMTTNGDALADANQRCVLDVCVCGWIIVRSMCRCLLAVIWRFANCYWKQQQYYNTRDAFRQRPISLDHSRVSIPLKRSYAVCSGAFLLEQKYYLIINSNFWQNIGEQKHTLYS